MTDNNYQDLFNIRTITGFLQLQPGDFDGASVVETKISTAVGMLRQVQGYLEKAGYTVQTIRLATNPFGEWLASDKCEEQLERLDVCLANNNIDAFSLGPAKTPDQVQACCAKIIAASRRFYCSADLGPTDTTMARAAARCIRTIASHDVLGNFQFCGAACAKTYIPFFPVAKAESNTTTQDSICFALGLENGSLAQHLLKECGSIEKIDTIFRQGMTRALAPIQAICQQATADSKNLCYVGIDSSLNPSLELSGSVAGALEQLAEVPHFGGPGTLAAAAAITKTLQSLPGIQLSGYCGLMLPLCEDVRLAELSGLSRIRIMDLLSIGQVCGVGIDTVPIPGDVDEAELALLLLDVAAIAHRWGKSLSCRVFPVPGKKAGEQTTFNFFHMVNATILPLS
jgi:uncharacterized protein (UPF0210 family)